MNKKSIGLDIIIFILIVILIIVFTIYLKNIIYDKKYIEKVNSITSDSVEIERKWIIDKEKIPYDLTNSQISMIEQTYICFSPEIRVFWNNSSSLVTNSFILSLLLLRSGYTVTYLFITTSTKPAINE